MKLFDARRWKLLYTLYKLAEAGALKEPIRISTKEIGAELARSQQTASRHLVMLEKMGLIERVLSERGLLIRITKSGRSELEHLHSRLSSLVMEIPSTISIKGEVFTGLKEGAYYMSLPGYRRQLIEKLGFDPYPGTLNLHLRSKYDVEARKSLDSYPAIEIEGFSDELRTYGPARCHRAIINDEVEGAVITAMRTHYGETVIELIAPVYLRGHFKLKDGDVVRVKVLTSPAKR